MTKEKQIKDRIENIRGTRKITRAMEMIASSRIKSAQSRMLEARQFTDMVEDFICNLGFTAPLQNERLVREREEEKTVLILGITSDKGLCGSYNTNIIELIEGLREDLTAQGKELQLHIIGSRGRSYFEYRGYKPVRVYEHLLHHPSFMDAREISRDLISRFVVGEADRALICYTRFVNPAVQKAEVMQILPIPITGKLSQREEEDSPGPPFECRIRDLPTEFYYEPSINEIMRAIIPEYIFTTVYELLLESSASEIGARMTSMRNASDNSNDLIMQLTRDYHKFRQQNITSEIMEVISGDQPGG